MDRQITISRPVGIGGRLTVAAPGIEVLSAVQAADGRAVSVVYSELVDPEAPSQTVDVHVQPIPSQYPPEFRVLDVLRMQMPALTGTQVPGPVIMAAVFVDDPQ